MIIIITNQAGIARSKYTEEDFEKLTKWMIEEFEKASVKISQVYHCPHHPDFSGKCECCKPNPKMILDAKKDFDINLSQSILIGDKNSDIEAGLNAGIGQNYLITTGHKIEVNKFDVYILDNLVELLKMKR